MAIAVVRQKERATIDSVDVPYMAYDLTIGSGSELDRDAAIAAVAAQGLIDQGGEADDFDYERLSNCAALVRLRYQDHDLNPFPLPKLPPSEVGSVSFAFNLVSFQPEHRLYSLGTLWRLPTESAYGTAPDFRGAVDVQDWGRWGSDHDYRGYTLHLPPETDSLEYILPGEEFTADYRNLVTGLAFHVHDGPGTFFGRNPGEVMLVRAQARQRTATDLTLSFGFSYRANGPRQIGDISTATISGAPEVDGHDYVWALNYWEIVGSGEFQFEAPYPRWVYCERIWERGDLNELGLPGSAD